MKYMTFNSSCSYAGIANMLEQYGVDTNDRTIALAIKLPYLFSYCDGIYLSGPMLQSVEGFNLYLNPIGYELLEEVNSADKIVDYLKSQKTAMLGIKTENTGKHAVVYTGTESDRYVFLNNKWEKEDSPCEICLTEDELKQRIDAEVVVATLQEIAPKYIDFTDKLKNSINILQANLTDIIELASTEETVANLRLKLNTLFRPLFLDGITMLNMIGETMLAQEFENLQQELLFALRKPPHQRICLKKYVSISKLQVSAKKYMELIANVTEKTKAE